MKTIIAFFSIWMLGLVSQSAQARTDYDPTVNFGQYKSFAFTQPDVRVGQNPVYRSPMVLQQIEGNLVREFANRGLTYQSTNPDLLVKVYTYTEKKTQTSYYGSPFYGYPFGGFGWYRWGYMPYYGGYNRPYQQQYTQGTLLVDLIDPRTNNVVWQGAVQGAVDRPNRLERQIARVFTKS